MLEGFDLAPLQGDADDTESVSYTHLDVYKRQRLSVRRRLLLNNYIRYVVARDGQGLPDPLRELFICRNCNVDGLRRKDAVTDDE